MEVENKIMKREGLLSRETASGLRICHTSFALWTIPSQVITINCGMVNPFISCGSLLKRNVFVSGSH